MKSPGTNQAARNNGAGDNKKKDVLPVPISKALQVSCFCVSSVCVCTYVFPCLAFALCVCVYILFVQKLQPYNSKGAADGAPEHRNKKRKATDPDAPAAKK